MFGDGSVRLGFFREFVVLSSQIANPTYRYASKIFCGAVTHKKEGDRMHNCSSPISNIPMEISVDSLSSEPEYFCVIGDMNTNRHHQEPEEEERSSTTILPAVEGNTRSDEVAELSQATLLPRPDERDRDDAVHHLIHLMDANNLVPPEDPSLESPPPLVVPPLEEETNANKPEETAEENASAVPSPKQESFDSFLPSTMTGSVQPWWWVLIVMPIVLSILFPASVPETEKAAVVNAPSSAPVAPMVVQDLTSFVAHERASTSMDVPTIADFPTDAFRRYAVAMCSSARSYEAARKNLNLQLSVVPEEVASKILDLVLVEGISQKNSIQDATSELGSDGQAQSYMAFWSTTFSPKSNDKKYETCFVLAGMAIKVADIVAGYKEETKEVVIGSEPCKCGYITACEMCPVLTKVTSKTPVFKRHSLSLKQQDELHRWMTLHALKSAESMLATGSSNKSADYNFLSNESVIQQLGWKKPSIDVVDMDDNDFFDSDKETQD